MVVSQFNLEICAYTESISIAVKALFESAICVLPDIFPGGKPVNAPTLVPTLQFIFVSPVFEIAPTAVNTE